jgi:hypothetical protein
MGDIIGGIIGGVGSLFGGNAALKGYNYLTGKNGIQSDVTQGTSANSDINALLTGGPGSAQARGAFGNYLGSTGYNFQMQQGEGAITGSAAARGLLNSGATAKELANYGQNLAGTTFNNYLTQLGNQANRGLQAAQAIGQAGTQGGAGQQSGISSGFNQLGSAVGSAVNNPAFTNIFGGL